MSGLLLRELQLHGLAERILIVAPSNLTFQWQRELREKFDQSFVVLKGAELRHDELSARRARRLEELKRQRSLTLQGVERITSVLVLPHPERGAADVRRHRPDPATEMTAMRVAMAHEEAQGRRGSK